MSEKPKPTRKRNYESIQTPRRLGVARKARELAAKIKAEENDPRPVPLYMAVAVAIDEALENRA